MNENSAWPQRKKKGLQNVESPFPCNTENCLRAASPFRLSSRLLCVIESYLLHSLPCVYFWAFPLLSSSSSLQLGHSQGVSFVGSVCVCDFFDPALLSSRVNNGFQSLFQSGGGNVLFDFKSLTGNTLVSLRNWPAQLRLTPTSSCLVSWACWQFYIVPKPGKVDHRFTLWKSSWRKGERNCSLLAILSSLSWGHGKAYLPVWSRVLGAVFYMVGHGIEIHGQNSNVHKGSYYSPKLDPLVLSQFEISIRESLPTIPCSCFSRTGCGWGVRSSVATRNKHRPCRLSCPSCPPQPGPDASPPWARGQQACLLCIPWHRCSCPAHQDSSRRCATCWPGRGPVSVLTCSLTPLCSHPGSWLWTEHPTSSALRSSCPWLVSAGNYTLTS